MAPTRIPRRIHILNYVLRIQQVSKRELQRRYGSKDRSVVGLWDDETLTISLLRRQSMREKRQTLLHELGHAIVDLINLDAENFPR